jgi:heterotetrameric sarcosine oxidase gamma subunit
MPELGATPAAELQPGHHGQPDQAGIKLRPISRAVVSVIARKGKAKPLALAVKQSFDVALPDTRQLARGQTVSFLWCGHQHWLAMADQGELLSTLRAELGALASLSEQSDSRIVLELSGGPTRNALAKLVPIDLHPRAFRPNDTALTLFGHIAGQITQMDEVPTYELMAPRSFAESFVHDVLAAGAEFGIDVIG